MKPRLFLILALALTPLAVRAADPTPTPIPDTPPTKEGASLRDLLKGFITGDADDEEGEQPTTMESDAGELFSPAEAMHELDLGHAVEWHEPSYAGQDKVAGWSANVFEVPPSMTDRVQFWRDVYTKYTSNQGIMHDRNHYDIVYETVDFASIMKDGSLTVFQKARARERFVKERRKDITERLKRLEATTSPEKLTGEDLRVWKLFENVHEPHKFKNAMGRGRVRFQLGQRDHFLIGLYYSGRYLRAMETVFREQGLPVELTRLPFVESSFNIHARSRVGASGIWQIMRRTAHAYPLRLKVNGEVDERNDPLRAAAASARLLGQNFEILQTWPLAITAYNHGSTGLRKIVGKMKTHDIATIVNGYTSRRFGFASENFYACFLAALDVERHATKYFGNLKIAPAIDAEEIKLKRPISFQTIVQFYDGDEALAQLANPHLLRRVRSPRVNIPIQTYVRVPKARVQLALDYQQNKLSPTQLALALKEKPLPGAVPTVAAAPVAVVAPVATPAAVVPAGVVIPSDAKGAGGIVPATAVKEQ